MNVGCAGPAAGTTTPACDFAEALGGDQFNGFLRWAPGVGLAAPAGYLGDGVTFHQVVGATYVPPGETEPANYFQVLRAGTSLGKSSKFSVVGKLASGLAAPAATDFGDVTVNDLVTKTLTFSNIGTTPVAVASAQVGSGTVLGHRWDLRRHRAGSERLHRPGEVRTDDGRLGVDHAQSEVRGWDHAGERRPDRSRVGAHRTADRGLADVPLVRGDPGLHHERGSAGDGAQHGR